MADESPAERHAAVGQLLDHYAHAVAVASEALQLPHHRNEARLPEVRRPDLVAALAPDTDWMEAERANVRALIRLAAEEGHDDRAWRLARHIWRFHYTCGYYDEILETHRIGLAAATRLGDPAAMATMHNYIASAYAYLSDYQAATQHLNRAIDLRRGIGDQDGEWISQGNLAVVSARAGRIQEAVDIYRRLGRKGGGRNDGRNLGLALMLLGRYEEALRVQRIALSVAVESKREFLVAQDLGNIGAVRLRTGHFHYAARLIRASIAHRARTGFGWGMATAINDLGVAYRHLGRLDEAERLHRRAIATAIGAGEREAESAAHNDLGLTLAVLGQAPAAVEAHRQALDLATRISHPYEQGRALAALAEHLESSDPAEAHRYWERALAVFRRIGVPERVTAERRLAALDSRNPLPK